MCRGDRRNEIYLDGQDCLRFLDTLEEVCERTGWRVHSYVLMSNHYHMLITTPEANLVAGMKWFQGTYTQRFNNRHRMCGHLFQGRYKALPVQNDTDYFKTVSSYIHLNPARAKMFDLEEGRLSDYPWSSYPAYLRPSRRPEWLDIGPVLSAYGWEDERNGRRSYREYMRKRVLEIACSEKPWEVDGRWAEIRQGWYLGAEHFRDELLTKLEDVISAGRRESYSGDESRLHDECEAERIIRQGLDLLGLVADDLTGMQKSAPEKQVLAWVVRKCTCVSNRWIAEHLKMGVATNLSNQLKKVEEDKKKYGGLKKKVRSLGKT